MYSLLRPLFFQLDPELTHHLALGSLNVASRLGLARRLVPEIAPQPVRVMGLEFPNPVGLAAGLDKNGDYFNALGELGFGFVEIGTVTPRPQPGNPKPRLFRLAEHEAILNRMGFNNKGVDYLVERVKQRRFRGILGINIGKNATTPVEEAENDYRIGLQKVYPWADYITINISSPNTPGLRALQFGEQLQALLHTIKAEQGKLAGEHQRYVPIAVKIAPDMNEAEIRQVAVTLLEAGIDGVIATNTTLSRDAVAGHRYAAEAGGLSGFPVAKRSTEVIAQLHTELGGRLPIIGVGGIMSGADAREKIAAGASLVQLYSGLIYRGPHLVFEAADAIASAHRSKGAG
ncbi:quinone-dependent dihydroorotate dehydrogenase [Gilvimarinus sp. F26214L]|uniref:quinone-dependent dihydroorotate dehydrogenase n=1 Tax=Gilvimarinus sp. DZF01 TaxID=3461371 RepID=UPI00404625FD